MLELFGISTPFLQYEGEDYADDGDIQSALRFLGLLGRGKPALLFSYRIAPACANGRCND
jgi:hypothetical protein